MILETEILAIPGEPIWYLQKLPKNLKEVLLIPISDLHFGDPLFSKKHLDRTVDFLKNTPNAFAILNGDLCDMAIKSSVGNVYRQINTPQDQRDWVIDAFNPVKHKLLGMTTGNHENRIQKEVGLDLSRDMAKDWGIPYRAEGMLIKVQFGNGNKNVDGKPYTYWVYFTHGYGGARTKAAKAVKVERLATWIHADVYIMSHDHVVNVAPDVYLIPDPRSHRDERTGFTIGKVSAHRKMLVKSNAYLKWGGYAEMGGFPPVDLETPIIKLSGIGGKPRVRVEV